MTRLQKLAAGAIFAVLLCRASSSMGVGDAAPDFSRPDLAGHPVDLAAYRGKPVLLNFWASWCGPCLEEMPQFVLWQQNYRPLGLQIIGVSMDDGPAPVKRLLARHPVNYPVLMGDASLGERFGGVLGLPLTYLIDPAGRIVARYQGGGDLAKMKVDIEALLRRR
jgi:peroxiredoxin